MFPSNCDFYDPILMKISGNNEDTQMCKYTKEQRSAFKKKLNPIGIGEYA